MYEKLVENKDHEINDYFDSIDFVEIYKKIYESRLSVLAVIVVATLITLLYLMTQPDVYKVRTVIAASESDESFFRGAGFNFEFIDMFSGGRNSARVQEGIVILNSRAFIESFVSKRNLVPELLAAESWDKASDKLRYDNSLYSKSRKTFEGDLASATAAERLYESYIKLSRENVRIALDKKTNFITIDITFMSPTAVVDWTNWIVEDINEHFRKIDIENANNTISYLESQLASAASSEVQTMIYQLIESQLKVLALAHANPDYAFKVLEPPIMPIEKDGPKRAIYSAAAGIGAGFIYTVLFLMTYYFRR